MAKKITRHSDAIAWEGWLESESGKTNMEASILKSPANCQFLQNRLWHAFMAGIKHGELKNKPQHNG